MKNEFLDIFAHGGLSCLLALGNYFLHISNQMSVNQVSVIQLTLRRWSREQNCRQKLTRRKLLEFNKSFYLFEHVLIKLSNLKIPTMLTSINLTSRIPDSETSNRAYR